jgi:hypothetical protein
MDIPTVIANFRVALQPGPDLALGERLTEALAKHDHVENFATRSWELGIIGFAAASMTVYSFEAGHLLTHHLGRLVGFTWSELEDFSGDHSNPVKAFRLEHPALPTGRIEIDAHDMTEKERDALRAALRRLQS